MCFPYGFANILFRVLLSWRQNNQSQIKCLKEGVNYTIKTASTALQLSENTESRPSNASLYRPSCTGTELACVNEAVSRALSP